MKPILTFLLGAILTGFSINVQANSPELPKVFVLGENEAEYEQLTQTYQMSLLEVCNNDIKSAFENWLDLMLAVDAYAQKINYDIKGVKLLMHVFWAEDGHIDHIGYLLHPDSRNVDTTELSAFFSSFIRNYQSSLKGSRKFSHYSVASFPTLSEKVSN